MSYLLIDMANKKIFTCSSAFMPTTYIIEEAHDPHRAFIDKRLHPKPARPPFFFSPQNQSLPILRLKYS